MSFKNIQGQDRPIEILKSYMEQGHVAGGYLFIGPEGIGKKMTALTLAKALNCLEEGLDACDKCASCLKIDKGQHPDVHIVDYNMPVDPCFEEQGGDSGDSQAVKIKHVRQLQKDISFRAYEGRKKVFIIDNAHRLTQAASNALLKILEEPPKDSVIILITDKPGLILKTVASRCKALRFSVLDRENIKNIFRNEYGVEDSAAHFIAYLSEGRLGNALALKDTGLLQEKNMFIDRFILSRRPDIEELSRQKKEEIRRHLNICATWFADIYLMKVGLPEKELTHLDRKDVILKEAGRYNFKELDSIMQAISDSVLYLERNINVRLLLHNLGAQLWKG